ncbi:hypothetical protein QL996_04825 [Planococcus sp. APC 4015]|nr:hypothetical protein [Planococcus sp. APC 4015]
MSTPDERIEELIAAAVAGALTPSERDELDRLRARHPWIEDEIASLGRLAERLHDSDAGWETPVLTDDLRARVVGGLPAGLPVAAPAEPVRTHRRWLTPTLAAACLALGLAIGIGVPALSSLPPTGPPGTLGALESLVVSDRVEGVAVEADLVAHTWGTEAVLDVTGLDVGETYSVVFVSADGTEFSAGQMLGSAVAIHCRLNAAVMRQDAARLEIRDADANPVALAELPDA